MASQYFDMYHGTERSPLMALLESYQSMTLGMPRIFKEYHGTFQHGTVVLFSTLVILTVVRSDILGCPDGNPSMLYLSRVIGVVAAPGALRPGWADGRRQAKVHMAPLSPVSGLVL